MDVEVKYGGDPIPGSPFPVDVAPPLDLDRVKVKNLGDSKIFNSRVEVSTKICHLTRVCCIFCIELICRLEK